MNIYVVSSLDYSSGYELNIYETEKEFLDYYLKLGNYSKDNIEYIIRGDELVPVIETKEVVKKWKLKKK